MAATASHAVFDARMVRIYRAQVLARAGLFSAVFEHWFARGFDEKPTQTCAIAT